MAPTGAAMNEATCDALVVGDGPAGCVAALALRRAGLRCTMLAPPMPANQRGAIESVPPMVPLLLAAAGLGGHQFTGAIAGRFDGMRSDGVVRFFQSGDGMTRAVRDEGWHVDRAQFDRVLLNHALEQGVTLQRDHVTAASCMTDGVAVETATTRHRARWLVDASGRSAMLQRLLGLAAVTRGPRMLAWRGLARPTPGADAQHDVTRGEMYDAARDATVNATPNATAAMPTFETSGSSWLWQAPLDTGTLAWTWAGEANAPPPVANARGFDVSWRLVRPAAGAAYRIVGDA